MKPLRIKQGDALKFTDTIQQGLTSLDGYSNKAYFYKSDGTELATITGSVSGLVVTYEALHAVTVLWPTGTYTYATKTWDSSGHNYTPSEGILIVEATNTPTPA
jgi:hypothetical protein